MAEYATLGRGSTGAWLSCQRLGATYGHGQRVCPWLYGSLPGELEGDPLIERDMLLCGLYGQCPV